MNGGIANPPHISGDRKAMLRDHETVYPHLGPDPETEMASKAYSGQHYLQLHGAAK